MEPYYSDESVTLYHGDCLQIDAWLEADVLCTDPPYGRDWKQGVIRGHHTGNAMRGIANDANTDVRDRALEAWGNRPAVAFGDLMLEPPKGTKLTAIYRKPADAGLRGAIGGIRRDTEAIYLVGKGWRSGIGGRSSVFATRNPLVGSPQGIVARSGGHPHAKALDVLEDLIGICPPGVIADPFAGSGSTLVAAKQLGRKAIGVELEERYAEICAKRLSQGVLPLGGVI